MVLHFRWLLVTLFYLSLSTCLRAVDMPAIHKEPVALHRIQEEPLDLQKYQENKFYQAMVNEQIAMFRRMGFALPEVNNPKIPVTESTLKSLSRLNFYYRFILKRSHDLPKISGFENLNQEDIDKIIGSEIKNLNLGEEEKMDFMQIADQINRSTFDRVQSARVAYIEKNPEALVEMADIVKKSLDDETKKTVQSQVNEFKENVKSGKQKISGRFSMDDESLFDRVLESHILNGNFFGLLDSYMMKNDSYYQQLRRQMQANSAIVGVPSLK